MFATNESGRVVDAYAIKRDSRWANADVKQNALKTPRT
jgi:hypothetical protein